jgi:hypothetical protein
VATARAANHSTEMAVYFSAHTIACLTKQSLRALMKDLMASTDLKVRRCVASQLGGRMIMEIEAPDQPTLEKWLERRRVNWEWIMRIDLDGENGKVRED